MDQKRKVRRNRFEALALICSGDWHTPLVTALERAKNLATSPETLAAITTLEQQLSLVDECIHTVTVVQPVPLGMTSQFLLSHVERCIDIEDSAVCIGAGGEIELTVRMRGCRDYVLLRAEGVLSIGVISAREDLLDRPMSFPRAHVKAPTPFHSTEG